MCLEHIYIVVIYSHLVKCTDREETGIQQTLLEVIDRPEGFQTVFFVLQNPSRNPLKPI